MNTDLRKKANNDFEKQVHACCFWKNYGKCEETQRYLTYPNRKKKTIWCQNQIIIFHRKLISNRNEERKKKKKTNKNRDTYE